MSAKSEVSTELRPNAVGTFGIVFFVLAFAAPLAAIMGVGPIVLGSGGSPGAPGAFAITTIILLVFSVGFAAMSREISGPGGFAVYIGKAFGPRAANAASFTAVLGYNAFLTGNLALFASTAAGVFADRLGVHLDWWVYALVALLIIGILGYGEVNLSVRVLSVLLMLEVIIILVLDGSVLGKGGASGINVNGFLPSAISQGGIGIVFLLAFACFVGFEATTLFGEEAKDRHRTIPRATYIAVLIVGVFYTLVMWVFQLGWGAGVTKAADTNSGGFIFDLNTRFVGLWSTDIMNWLVITSIFACVLSMHGALSRYLFSMGRTGSLPSYLAVTHPRMKSPHRASLTQSVVSFILIGIMALLGADPIRVIYSWFVGTGSVAIVLLYLTASVAVCFALRRSATEERLWVTTIAPIVAAVAMVVVLVLAVINFPFLTGSTNVAVNLLWLLPPIAAIIGFVVTRAGAPLAAASDLASDRAPLPEEEQV